MQLASRVNQYVSDQAPWAVLKVDRERAGTILYVALRCIDNLKMLFAPFLPFTSQRLHELLGHEGWLAGPLEIVEVTEADGSTHAVLTGDYASVGRPLGAVATRTPARRLREPRPLFAKLDPDGGRRRRARAHGGAGRHGVIDTHAHLDACDEAGRGRRRARASGRRRRGSSRSARASTRCRAALAIAEAARRASSPRSGSTRTRPPRPRPAGSTSCAPCSTHPLAVAVGETGLDGFHTFATLVEQRRAVRRAARARARSSGFRS